MKSIRMHLVQANPVVGDIDGNVAAYDGSDGPRPARPVPICDFFRALYRVGYPPEDLF